MAKKPLISTDRSTPKNLAWKDNYTIQHMLYNLAKNGCDNEEIASLLGVRLSTLRHQLSTIPELEEALVKGRSEATQAMVAQLYKTAMGGQIQQEIREVIDADGKRTVTVLTKEMPPNPTLMIFWLVNRDGANWRHVRQLITETRKTETHGESAEADKIARLAGSILEVHPNGHPGEYSIPNQTAREAGPDNRLPSNLPGNVPHQTADCLQNDAVDLPAETGTEHS